MTLCACRRLGAGALCGVERVSDELWLVLPLPDNDWGGIHLAEMNILCGESSRCIYLLQLFILYILYCILVDIAYWVVKNTI